MTPKISKPRIGCFGTFPFDGQETACRVIGRDGMLLNIQYLHPDGRVVPDAWIPAKNFTPDNNKGKP
jgi:hypothetical protein